MCVVYVLRSWCSHKVATRWKMTACEKSGSQSMLPRRMDGKRRASCEPEPDLLSIDPVTSLRGSICNRKADRPPKPTLINSRTLCKQLAKRHKGSDVSYETMTITLLPALPGVNSVFFDLEPRGIDDSCGSKYGALQQAIAYHVARPGRILPSHRRPMTMAHSVSLREGERWQQEHGAVSHQQGTGPLIDSEKAEKGSK
ncbi:uncharacterized protein CCOS01_12048 [Colletotrichum costaricense]|uniref:Uncharacterized protein n=1 Tax=Colletotrichum costaricense TaxID=1209916 RepID=A0AAI9YNS9_9PEZI|nr:uncharacterized protein CCOS01_12048 [Colletotrichum costaricense]KAK1517791.1 hypothetical protein CCOS01_12048 [Colletotrichum costaricense]